MTKCDFCVRFAPRDGCYWEGLDSSLRKSDCEIAIQRMEKALASIGTAIQPICVTGISMEETNCRTPIASTTYYTNKDE